MPDFGIFRGFNEKLFGDKLYAGQLPINLGLIGSENFTGIDIDAQAFFDRVTAAGGTLSATEQIAIDTLVKQMKLDGIWNKMKAIYPMVGASAAACAQNLKSSSFTGTFNGGWTFSSTGAKPNGLNAYINTGLNVNNELLQNSTHLSYYSRTNIISNQVDMGLRSLSSSNTYLLFNFNNAGFSAINAAQTTRTSPANPTTGLLIGSRILSTEEKYYTNNVSQTLLLNSTGKASYNIYIGCYNNENIPLLFSSKECAIASIGDGLTDTESSDFYTAVQAFQTTLSRQV
jgi:hypothetical protein